MSAHRLTLQNQIDASVASDAADAQMVGRMRLVLSISALLAIFIDPIAGIGVSGLIWMMVLAYVFHSLVVCFFSEFNAPFSQRKLIHWFDVCWGALIVFHTDGIHSFFFLLFFFAILTSSFRWGFDEGARVTLASAALFAACGLGTATQPDLPWLLLRTTFLLTLGYMSVHWGGSKVELKRRLALLRDVSQVSNPRFGVDHTITRVLEKTLAFFGGDSCLLVMRDKESGAYSLRTIKDGKAKQPITAETITPEAASPLMAISQNLVLAYSRPLRILSAAATGASVYDDNKHKWIQHDGRACESLAELLDAHSFISSPLSLRKGNGRIYVVSRKSIFRKADALFLRQIGAQAFPVIENIELLDRLASDAASTERRRLALDLHDTAIQPYIGLKLALNAVRNKAASDNPLTKELDKLEAMATKVIDDLRSYASTVRSGTKKKEQLLLSVLRQQTAQIRDFYGIDIEMRVEDDINITDRLTAEVVQIVREGLSNICKHTMAQRGTVRVRCKDEWLSITIENESDATAPTEFTPRSISERAAALGGKAQVRRGPGGVTAVLVDIPI